MNIISIDIGEKNFAFSFIYVTKDEILEKGYFFKVDDVYLYNVIEKPKQTIVESCLKISTLLQLYDSKIRECKYILIEQQMRPNIRAQRIAQHVWSYLHTKYIFMSSKLQCQIISVSSTLKTKMFTSENLDSKQRKKWVTDAVHTKKIINLAKNHAVSVNISDCILEKIKNYIKQDDVCDTIVQALVFLIKNQKMIKNL